MSLYELVPETVLTETAMEETTLVSDSPACQPASPAWPAKYLSVRVTVLHVDVMLMLETIFKGMDYICYKHKGLKTAKEHVHVLIPDIATDNKIRKRLAKSVYKGNQCHSVKLFDNGFLSGIQYASKEGTQPIVCGDYDAAIAAAPKWQLRQSKVDSYMSRSTDNLKKRHWQLTYSNIVCQAVDYAKQNALSHCSFKEVVQHMCQHSNWAPCNAMLIHGLHDYYTDRYDCMIGNYKTGQKPDMSWFSFKG